MTSALAANLNLPEESAEVATTVRQLSREEQRKELDRMADVMVQEKGLFNVMQTAIALDVSRERVYELMELGMLKKLEFLGRIYLSATEVQARRDSDLKAGRPRRTLVQRVKDGLKSVAYSDAGQVKQGGTTEYAAKQLAKKRAREKK